MHREPIDTVIVLAGGQSKRFQGNKALAVYEGRTLLERACSHALQLTSHVIVSCSEAHTYSEAVPTGVLLRPDKKDFAGPIPALRDICLELQGVVLVLPVDMPLVTTTVLKEFIARSHRLPAYVSCIHQHYALCMYYAEVFSKTDASVMSFRRLHEHNNALDVRLPEEWAPSFANINTRQDFQQLP